MSRSLLLLLTLAAAPLLAIDPPREKEKWIALETDEFRIYSNASARQTTAIATDLFRMRDTIGKLTQLKVRSAVPTHVYIFDDERSFAPYRDVVLGRKSAANVTGVFLGGEEGNYILLQGDASGGVDRVVYHELTHFFVKNTLTGLPLWLHEGIAEYYSTFAVKGDEVSLGMPISEHVLWLRNQPLIPLAQLFAIDEKSPEYNEGNRQGVYYAQSWALLHYLLVGAPERRSQLPLFLDALARNEPIDQSFRAAFGTTFEEMEKELRVYVRRPTMQYRRYTVAELTTPTLAEPAPMPREEVLSRLAELLTRPGDRGLGDAERFLTEALKVNDRHAASHAQLGLLRELQGQSAEAAASFERAVILGAKNPNVYMTYGASLLQKLVPSVNAGRGATAAEVAKPRELFRKATELAPASARAWAGLGATYAIAEGDATPGIAALEKSLALAPGQEDVAFHLVQLYARAGRREDAARLVETVIARAGDPEQLAIAREAVLIADLRRAEKLLQADKLAEAAPLLRSVQAATTNPALRAHVEKVLAAVGSEEKAARQIDAINAAISLANRGKYKEALAAVDAVIPEIEDAEMLANVKKLRADFAKLAK